MATPSMGLNYKAPGVKNLRIPVLTGAAHLHKYAPLALD